MSGFAFVASSHATCKEFKIVDLGDHVEVTCIGDPLTEAQRKEINYQNAQEAKRLKNSDQTGKSVEIPEPGKVVLKSFDIKYIPSNMHMRNGMQIPGDYSVQIDAKNIGRKGNATFKIKLPDSSGFELESTTFKEFFEEN